MSRRWLLSLLCLTVLTLSAVQLTHSRAELRVNEAASKLLLEKNPAEVLLAVENPSSANVNANVQLELLDPNSKSRGKTTQVHSIAPGSQTLKLSLAFAFSNFDEKERTRVLWYRLHYRLSPQQSPAETLADGFISLSEMTPDVFGLRVSANEMVREGNRYRVRVQAVHPITQKPTEKVRIDAQVSLETDDDKVVKLSATSFTDTKGRALLDFALPPRFPPFPHNIQASGGELQVTGRKGAIVVQTTGNILVDQFARVLITTDKPLYQPGQVMHIRAVLFTPSRQALAQQATFFKISDPEDGVMYRTVATTSRFGIASVDWSVPENARLGDYRISVGVDGGDDETTQDVTISRYELPNFKVNVDLDRKFYLPGQNASVIITADYLFGQPVTRGNVRVVRESEREWNYREQKWDLTEEDEQKGETRADGSFLATLDLKSYHEDLADTDYSRFRDITYAAYFTDPTTNRTEQRRFDVRVTKDPIHVYVVRGYEWSYSRELPLQLYVSTFYADGSPARCRVNVAFTDDSDDPRITKRAGTVVTNRYGLAKISTRLPNAFADADEVDVVLSASDSRGRKGSGSQDLRLDDAPTVRVETDKTIYRRGEPITALITASGTGDNVIVDLASEAGLIRSERVDLHHGRGSITFPFKSDFKNTLTIAAYPDIVKSQDTIGRRTVLYPYNSELNVDVQSSQETYRPGEEAQLNLSVRSAANRSQESALGVVVLDQAVVERFRTDQDFGGHSYRLDNAVQQFLGLEDQLAGVSLRDLQRLKPSEPVSSDLDLLAAILLRNTSNYSPAFYDSDESDLGAAEIFGGSINEQLHPLKTALSDRYDRTLQFPSNETELHDSLAQLGFDFNNVRDPWGMPYRAEFFVDKQANTLRLLSGGPDKRYETADDFAVDQMSWAYFRSIGETIDRAIMRYHKRTGRFIRDAATLAAEVSTDGLNLDQLRDHWGKPYRLTFAVEESNFVLDIASGGPDEQFSTDPRFLQDDFSIWKSATDYFFEPRSKINDALTEHLNRTKTFPNSEQELHQVLRDLGEDFQDLRDVWGRPYYYTFGTQSVYTQRTQLENRGNFGDRQSLQPNITPVTQTVRYVTMQSVGPDARAGTADDFSVATFTGVISEQPRVSVTPIVFNSGVVLSGNNGSIVGVVTDPTGAAIPGVTVTATRSPAGQTYETSTDDNGRYTFASLPPAVYELTFDLTGFKKSVITEVVVRSQNIIEVNTTLDPGTVSETVSITASAESVNASTAQISDLPVTGRTLSQLRPGTVNIVTKSGSPQMSTPPLREYFPETLLWQPSIETDKQGRAQINFKLADNITTWKTIVIGSTEDGRIGMTEKAIKAFQPFFVEHDPPRVLTEGDEISLPVVVRNYLSRAQKVDLEIKPESWFSLTGPGQKQTNVAAGDASRETFDFRVVASIKDGKQRITARGSDDHDAIEKPVTVHPDGEDVSVTAGNILEDATSVELDIPQSMSPNSSRGKLKIYPNLLAHVAEGVEAIMQRPYGCGEQTISSTYPSLLLLRHYNKSGQQFPLSAQAQRYLSDGYSRLMGYRAEEGGFTYWGHDAADVALTAYAIQFLVDAGEVMSVNPEALKDAREWLVKQQRPDGSWRPAYLSDREAEGPGLLLTAYVARVLARTDAQVSEPLKRALGFLASRLNDEPYLLASYALAAIDAKDTGRAQPALEKLRVLAQTKENTSYWNLNTDTPFHGWGNAGRVETTALVVQALRKNCQSQTAGCDGDREIINRGLLFLLQQKDRFGVWHSTQATVNVLDAMFLLSSGAPSTATAHSVDIIVNGNPMPALEINDGLTNPVTVDISKFLKTGKNHIDVKRPQGLPFASVQGVANYYLPWTEPRFVPATAPRLQVTFDKTDAKINEEITCRVEAGRGGSRGYGMMLAEIGIPPGAEVDRSSLQAVLKGWSVDQYDVLPDRVVVYLWPPSGGVSFSFKFRPRFGLNAKTAASTLYDYYNPDARVVVAPSVFRVR